MTQSPNPTEGSTASADVWGALRLRPLQTPPLTPSSGCLAAQGHGVSPSFGLGLGEGPVHPVGLGTEGALTYAPPTNADSHEWGGQKALWAVDAPHRSGGALIRGR